jgi:hypothetical protein
MMLAKPLFKKNKRSVLFTVMILLILGSLLMATIAFLNRSEEIGFMINSNMNAYKVSSIKADISKDYLDILGVDVTNIMVNNYSASLGLHYLLSSKKQDPIVLLSEYKAYMAGVFSSRTNVNITLDMNSSFAVQPYNTTFYVNSTVVSASLSSQYLTGIHVVAYINDSIGYLKQNFSSKTLGNVPFTLKVYDRDGQLIFSDNSSLNITLSNLYFIEFNSTIPTSRFYLNLSSSKLQTYVTQNMSSSVNLTLSFNSTQKNKIYLNTGAKSTLRPISGGVFVKDSPLEIAYG